MSSQERDKINIVLSRLLEFARGFLPESTLAKQEKAYLYGMVESMALTELDGLGLLKIELYSTAFAFVRYIEQVLGLDSPLKHLTEIREREEAKIRKSRANFTRNLEQSLGLGKEKVEPWLQGMRNGAFYLATVYFREPLSDNEMPFYVFPVRQEFASVAKSVTALRPEMDDFQRRGVEDIFSSALKML